METIEFCAKASNGIAVMRNHWKMNFYELMISMYYNITTLQHKKSMKTWLIIAVKQLKQLWN